MPLEDFAITATRLSAARPSPQEMLAAALGRYMFDDPPDISQHLTGATFVNVTAVPANWSRPSDWAPSIKDPFVVPRRGDRITIAFTLQTLAQVESLITARCQLKGTGVVLGEVLTPAERRERQALYPQFKEARAAGLKAQFKRGRLFVDGKRVLQSDGASPVVSP